MNIGNPYQSTVFVVGTVYRGPRYGPVALPRGAGRRQQTPRLCKVFPPKAKHWETGTFEMIRARTQRIEKPRSSLMQRRTPFSFERKKRRGAQFSLIPGRDEIYFQNWLSTGTEPWPKVWARGVAPRGC